MTSAKKASLVRLAASLPKGSPERRSILAGLKPGLQDPLIYKGTFQWKVELNGVGIKYLVFDVGAASLRLHRSKSTSSWEIQQQVDRVHGEGVGIRSYRGVNEGPGNWKLTAQQGTAALIEYLDDIKSVLETKIEQIQKAETFLAQGVPEPKV